MKAPVTVALLACAGCASVEVDDTSAVEPGAAYVAVRPNYIVGESLYGPIDLTLVCVDMARTKHSVYLQKLRNGAPTVLKLKPGVCYVDNVKVPMTGWSTTHKPFTTLFEVRAGTLNYPGDWDFTIDLVHSHASGTAGSFRIGHTVHLQEDVVARSDTEREVRESHPLLASRLPFQYTKVDRAKLDEKRPDDSKEAPRIDPENRR